MYKKCHNCLRSSLLIWLEPLQTSNQSSKINYRIAGINKDLLINGTMKTEGRLEAYKESKDTRPLLSPRVCSSLQACSAECMAMRPSHVGSCIIEEDDLGLQRALQQFLLWHICLFKCNPKHQGNRLKGFLWNGIITKGRKTPSHP